MALIDNIGSLIGMFMQPNKHQESQKLANRAGVDTNDFAKIASIGLPLLLQAMNRNTQNKEGLASFNQALNEHQTRNNYDSLDQFAQNVDANDGDKIVNHVLGGDRENVNAGLAQRLNVNPGTVQKTLAILAPLVMKFLADRKQEKNLGPDEIQKETQEVSHEATQQVRNLNKTDSNGGVLGNLLDSFTNNDGSDNQDKGLLDDIFNLFK